jgi:hypothetical protein
MACPEETRRREQRGSVVMQGAIRHNITCRTPVSISDLSARGCRVFTADEGIGIGSCVFVRLNDLAPLRATARWRRGGNVGLEFDQPLYLPVLDHLLNHWQFTMTVELETN